MFSRTALVVVGLLLSSLVVPGGVAQSAQPRADIAVSPGFTSPTEATSLPVRVENFGPDPTTVIVSGRAHGSGLALGTPSGCPTPCVFALAAGEGRDLVFPASGATPGGAPFTILAFPVGSVAGDQGVYYSRIDRNLDNNRVTGVVKAASANEPATNDESPGGDDGGSDDDAPSTGAAPTPPGAKTPGVLTFALDGPEAAVAGELVSYTLALANAGPGVSAPGRFTVGLAGGAFAAFEAPAGVMCARTATALSCSVGALPAGESRALVAHAIAPASGAMTASSGDASVTTTVAAAAADLQLVTFSASPASAQLGERINVVLVIQNHGPQRVTNAYGEMDIPDGVDSSSLAGTPCVKHGENQVRCFMGTIENGKSKKLEFGVHASIPGDFSVTARAGSAVADPVSGNNAASASVSVAAPLVG